MQLNPFKYEYLFSYSVDIKPGMDLIKNGPWGMRIMGHIAGGSVWGPKLSGNVLPVGADWAVVTSNGVVHIDVRATLQADNGALIYMQYGGKMDLGGPEGYENYKAEKIPPKCYIQTTPVLETDHPSYLWMNRVSCFGIGRVDFIANPVIVQYDVYAFYSLPDE